MSNQTIALAGQPNCGKSTLFNLLTGARQYVANYPGVTVEKLAGYCTIARKKVSVVDLPGTYAFTSYSPEEMAARDFILNEHPNVVLAVVDASTLDKGLYFTLQLLEMGRPVILVLNMMDVAKRRGLDIDVDLLSQELGIPVVPIQATNSKTEGRQILLELLEKYLKEDAPISKFNLNYGALEESIEKLLAKVSSVSSNVNYPSRWIALKLFEEDSAVQELVNADASIAQNISSLTAELHTLAQNELGISPVAHIGATRHSEARRLYDIVVKSSSKVTRGASITEKIDAVACHRVLGPIVLLGILFLFYNISVTYGNILAAKVWPIWGAFEAFVGSMLPHQGFLDDPLLRSMVEWVVKSVTAVLNYIPIFLLMFSFVYLLEGSGYMARIAFILDRIFNSYGLHGQSTLPLILGGVYVGGCAIPGVVATRAIPDEKARFTTILIVPMMNCLAKVPLYLLLVSGFFAAEAGSVMFFMGTITLLMALIVAKLLNWSVLRSRPSAPFIIELPSYHMPILRNVVHEVFLRIWTFIKRILTIVVAVSIVVFALVFFPDLSSERKEFYQAEQQKIEDAFMKQIQASSFSDTFTKNDILPLIRYQDNLRKSKQGVNQEQATKINEEALKNNPVYASIVLRKGKDGKKLAGALRKLDSQRKNLRREIRQERFENSYLGVAGKSLEFLTAGAGFDWRMNIALLSALAAKENSAATLGALYGFEGSAPGKNFEEYGFTPLHAIALMVFMSLYPPCLPASIMVRNQTGATKWMIFSIIFQMTIGLIVATFIFSGGKMLGLTGLQAMWTFYGICLGLVVILGVLPSQLGSNKKVTSN